MTTYRYIGTSLNKKQVDTLAITGAGATNDTITLTINNIDFVITVGGTTTTAGIATTVQQAYSGTTLTDTTASATIPVADGGASLIPQFSEFTATVSGSTVTFTGNGSNALAGKPITMSAAKSGTVTITYTANATTPTSQFKATEPDNYSPNGTPTDGDTLVFDNGSTDLRYSLSIGAQPTTITKYKSYTGNVGLSEVNSDTSSKPYHEYRTPTYLTLTDSGTSATTTVNLEVGEGQGSGRFKLDSGASITVMTIFGKGSRLETGVPCILWKGSASTNQIRNSGGDLGIAFFGGETATVSTLITGSGPFSTANTICGSGVTLTTATLNGGTQETNSAVTTANHYAGNWTHKSGTVTTANIYGGTHYPAGAATYTTINLYGGTFDCTQGAASFAITNPVQMYKGAKFLDPDGRTGNPVFVLNGCTLADVTIVLKAGKTITTS